MPSSRLQVRGTGRTGDRTELGTPDISRADFSEGGLQPASHPLARLYRPQPRTKLSLEHRASYVVSVQKSAGRTYGILPNNELERRFGSVLRTVNSGLRHSEGLLLPVQSYFEAVQM